MPFALSWSSFLLRNVCLSVRLTVESDAVCWPARPQNRSTIIAKIDRKSIPGEVPGHPKSTRNRCRDPPGPPRSAQERPEGVSGASRERPGSVLGRPRSVPGELQGRPGDSPGPPWHAWRRPRHPFRSPSASKMQVGPEILHATFSASAPGAIFTRFSLDFRACGRVVLGTFSKRISLDLRFERAKPDPHETPPIAILCEGRPFRSESTRSSEEASENH